MSEEKKKQGLKEYQKNFRETNKSIKTWLFYGFNKVCCVFSHISLNPQCLCILGWHK